MENDMGVKGFLKGSSYLGAPGNPFNRRHLHALWQGGMVLESYSNVMCSSRRAILQPLMYNGYRVEIRTCSDSRCPTIRGQSGNVPILGFRTFQHGHMTRKLYTWRHPVLKLYKAPLLDPQISTFSGLQSLKTSAGLLCQGPVFSHPNLIHLLQTLQSPTH